MPVVLEPNDTIVAIASPPGPSKRGIVRLSGPAATGIVLDEFVTAAKSERLPRRARIWSGSLRVDGLRPLLPVMLALWPAPRTYTGQNVVEVHMVGAVPLVSLVLAHCLARGARQAEPGEFTLRAFLSGRLDLTRAEAVLGVIEATNPAQLDAALAQLAGGLSGPLVALRDQLLDLVAYLEANLDFTDEHDVHPLGRAVLAAELDESSARVARLAQRLGERESTDGLPRVVLVGPPNVGKSRLFNALVGHARAIVSPQAGTTRDYLCAMCDCDGVIVELVDTAGIESGGDRITGQAQAQRVEQTERADLLLACRSVETVGLHAAPPEQERRELVVWTKADQREIDPGDDPRFHGVVTSAARGIGLRELRSAIARAIHGQRGEDNLPAGTGARCRGSLRLAEQALSRASKTALSGGGDELVALDVRSAVDELGKVVGAVVTDDVLDRIFRRFCIGK